MHSLRERCTLSEIKPTTPSCEGFQFARNPYDSDNYLSVSRDQYNDEIPEDRPMHGNATPEMSASPYQGRHYAPNPVGGTPVNAAPSSVEESVNVHAAERGSES